MTSATFAPYTAHVIDQNVRFFAGIAGAMSASVVCGLLLAKPLGLVGIWLRIKRDFIA